MSAIETRQLYNFIQGSDISGVSSYDIWKSLNPNGTEAEFLEYIRSGPKGEQGPEGPQGSSARVYFLMCSDNVMERTIHDALLPSYPWRSRHYQYKLNTHFFCRNQNSPYVPSLFPDTLFSANKSRSV